MGGAVANSQCYSGQLSGPSAQTGPIVVKSTSSRGSTSRQTPRTPFTPALAANLRRVTAMPPEPVTLAAEPQARTLRRWPTASTKSVVVSSPWSGPRPRSTYSSSRALASRRTSLRETPTLAPGESPQPRSRAPAATSPATSRITRSCSTPLYVVIGLARYLLTTPSANRRRLRARSTWRPTRPRSRTRTG